ncbi:hypothetical protein Kuja_0140 [Vibrio phage vB_VchM_Kuja]|uniref:Calcineurin-like phosphoesterase domain-containing protein n=1 Tax=Vibrio phage vB_VchM_Kuja TaxID=2686437 RepID=A0A6B9J5C3_9CAUD|nr:SbcD-like subunit of palindrome specific endonuclease [Vibrio phage vB_VchM_Kuja]QGZ16005.1 hypothetical protein Kuja_0140 [Vibrio phage vB_VchM_Kuja]
MSFIPVAVLLGDTHLGCRNGSHHMRSFIKNYIKNRVVAYCKEHNIKQIIQTGDMFDRRSTLYARDYYYTRNDLTSDLMFNNLTWTTIPGNHDIALADSVELSWTQMAEDVSNGFIKNINKAGDYYVGDVLVCFIPWVCEDNIEEVKQAVEKSNAKICVGHFEFAGFPMYQNSIAEKGTIGVEIFRKFQQVISGHYHTRSENGNIRYIGAPYHLNWQDYADGLNRGFEVMYINEETDEIKFEFVQNTESDSVFRVFYYDQANDPDYDKYVTPEYLNDVLGFKGQIVRVQVLNKEASKNKFDKFLQAIKAASTIDYMVIDNSEILVTSEVVIDEAVLQMDVLNVLNQKVDKSVGVDTASVKLKLLQINERAQKRELI